MMESMIYGDEDGNASDDADIDDNEADNDDEGEGEDDDDADPHTRDETDDTGDADDGVGGNNEEDKDDDYDDCGYDDGNMGQLLEPRRNLKFDDFILQNALPMAQEKLLYNFTVLCTKCSKCLLWVSTTMARFLQ